jgi:hypothetical protein
LKISATSVFEIVFQRHALRSVVWPEFLNDGPDTISADGTSGERVYEGVRLIGPDSDKLVALCDALALYCQGGRAGHNQRSGSCVGLSVTGGCWS